jgi:hypothetical protein
MIPSTATFPIPDPVTPDWLTGVLRPSGVLGRGAVLSLGWEPTGAFNSATIRLRLRYPDDAPSEAPTRLILKRNISDEWGREAGIEEVRFYNLIASLPDHPRITAPCYAAAYDEESGQSYLLLQDMSSTHRPPRTRDQQISIVDGVPSAADIATVTETLAQLHAYWWEHPLLDAGHFAVGYWSRTRDRFEQYLKRRTASWQKVITREGTWLPDDIRLLYEEVFTHLPSYWERSLKPRFETMRQLTLTHGDAYFANFLCPAPPATGPAYLLDWQSPEVDIGAYDIVNLCATFWTSQQRHEDEREAQILRRYHAALQAHGASQYAWEDLLTDYQQGLIFWLLMPIQDAADGSRKDYWWPKMQCLVTAFREWRCASLLGMEVTL